MRGLVAPGRPIRRRARARGSRAYARLVPACPTSVPDSSQEYKHLVRKHHSWNVRRQHQAFCSECLGACDREAYVRTWHAVAGASAVGAAWVEMAFMGGVLAMRVGLVRQHGSVEAA
eukprot:2319535-Rhodomonas_salina.2